MPFPSLQLSGLDFTDPRLLLLSGSLCLMIGVGFGYWIARRRRRGRKDRGILEGLETISRAREEIRDAGGDPLEIAETAFLQAAQLLPASSFQIGLFDGDDYRTLLRIHEGDRIPNLRLPVPRDDRDLLHILRAGPDAALLLKQDPEFLPGAAALFEAEITAPGSAVLKPLQAEGRPFGLMAARQADGGTYSAQQELIFGILADQVAQSLERSSLQEEADYRFKLVDVINEVSRRLISLKPLGQSYSDAAELLLTALAREQVRLFELIDGELVLRACEPRVGDLPDVRMPLGTGPVGMVGGEGRKLQYTSVPDEERGQGEPERAVSGLAVPLRVEGKILGVLDIQSRTQRPFSAEEIKTAEMIAAQLAIATLEIQNFTRQREESYIRTVLLEVARHAARPGDPAQALQSVLQLTTLIAGTRWAVLLLSDEGSGRLRVGPMAGIRRSEQGPLQTLTFDLSDFGVRESIPADEMSGKIRLPATLATALGAEQVTGFVLGDGEESLGLLLIEATPAAAERTSLMAGIAHQVSLRLENVRLMQAASRRQALENEIAMAREIQTSFLPRIVPQHAGWQVGVSWASAREVGGDFYDFIRLDPGQSGTRWGIAIADVSGKSVPAALFMAVSRTLLRSIAPSHLDPGLVLRRLNSMLQLESLSDFFVSIFYAVWEPETGSIACANGGHNPPLLIAPDGTSKWLAEHGIVLGVRQHASYATLRYRLPEGSHLILYTDGVTEASAPDGEFFGPERLRRLCESAHEQDAQSIANSISRCVREFGEVEGLSDDLTVLTLKRVVQDSREEVATSLPGGEG